MADHTSSFSASRRRAWASSRSPAGASASLRPAPLEQAAVERLLQPLDLLAGGGLADAQRRGRGGDAVGVDDRQEGADQGDVEVSAHKGS